MLTKRRILAAASAVAMACFSVSADATVLIQGTGYWNGSAPTTNYSAPDSSFHFSFNIPDQITKDGDSAYTTNISNFSYTLDDVSKGVADEIRFYGADQSGLFDLIFGSTAVSLFGADIGSSGTIGPPGGYSFTAGINGTDSGSLGFVTVIVKDAGAVPEPATWGMMILGLGAVGGTMRYRRRKTTVAYAA